MIMKKFSDEDISLVLNIETEGVLSISAQDSSSPFKKSEENSNSKESQSKEADSRKSRTSSYWEKSTTKERRPTLSKKGLKNFDQGSFSKGDNVEKVILATNKDGGDRLDNFLVSWRRRRNGVKPRNSFVSRNEMRKYAKTELINYYESKIEWIVSEGPKASTNVDI